MEERVACILLHLCESSPTHLLDNNASPFDLVFNDKTLSLKDLPVQDYIRRLEKYTNTSPTCITMGIVLIDRILNNHKREFFIHKFNVHRLLLTSLLVSSKFWDDNPPKNVVFAKAGCVSVHDLFHMEVTFLSMIGFDLAIPQESFWLYCTALYPPQTLPCSDLLLTRTKPNNVGSKNCKNQASNLNFHSNNRVSNCR